jgi:trans-AT polyketide synthase/acyltransferase/oxidoreductase domain-containing protein
MIGKARLPTVERTGNELCADSTINIQHTADDALLVTKFRQNEMSLAKSSSSRVTISPQQLGAYTFRQRYRIKYAYLTGAMYKGIASKELVVAIGKAGLLGFLGSAGMKLAEIESQIQFIQQQLSPEQNYGMNLLCHLDNPQIEMDTVELYLKHGVTCVEASAFMRMTPALVYYRLSGLHKNSDNLIECQHKIIAKVSRPEVAQAFLSPPPANVIKKLLDEGRISQKQAELATKIAMSYDICVEADSGGHTDRGIATVLLPAIQSLKQEIEQKHKYHEPIHIGLSGGIGTPQAAVAAFMMGADFILTGSINQCTVEAGTSDRVKDLLQDINVQDTDYAPAGDMFELGAKVQVLKKGVFFPARANKLFMLYNHYDGWDEIPEKVKTRIETRYFQKTFAQVWQEVQEHRQRKGQQATLDKAAKNPKHKMALVFRWYFAYSTRLAFAGDERNQVDFQVHTGPALGAFNQWVKGSELKSWRNRHVDQIAEKLMQETANLLSSQINRLI